MTLYEATSIVVIAFLVLAVALSALITAVLIGSNVRATVRGLRRTGTPDDPPARHCGRSR